MAWRRFSGPVRNKTGAKFGIRDRRIEGAALDVAINQFLSPLRGYEFCCPDSRTFWNNATALVFAATTSPGGDRRINSAHTVPERS